MDDASRALLRVDNLGYASNGQTLIEHVTFELAAGPRTIVLGANGAGKSMLLRLLHGLLQPVSGSVTWIAPGRESTQAMVFQRPVLLRRSALANIHYALKLSRVAPGLRAARAQEALRQSGLAEVAHRPARVLSGGEQQRLALARAWALGARRAAAR
ncbi:MAG: ATP-binding cassette domain-containing protein [Rhodospirillales bacterium]